jgi:hypothetical protein
MSINVDFRPFGGPAASSQAPAAARSTISRAIRSASALAGGKHFCSAALDAMVRTPLT